MVEIGQRWLKLFKFQKAPARLFFLQKSIFLQETSSFSFSLLFEKVKGCGGRGRQESASHVVWENKNEST